MVLHSQQTSIRRRISLSSVASESSSPSISPEPSPSRYGLSLGSPRRRRLSPPHSSRDGISAWPRSPRSPCSSRSPSLQRPSVACIPEEPLNEELQADQDKLFAVNRRIKATLTDLLNCESVKQDSRMRSWVQTRLMDSQHEHNDQRRKHISESTMVQAECIRRSSMEEEDRPRKLSM